MWGLFNSENLTLIKLKKTCVGCKTKPFKQTQKHTGNKGWSGKLVYYYYSRHQADQHDKVALSVNKTKMEGETEEMAALQLLVYCPLPSLYSGTVYVAQSCTCGIVSTWFKPHVEPFNFTSYTVYVPVFIFILFRFSSPTFNPQYS